MRQRLAIVDLGADGLHLAATPDPGRAGLARLGAVPATAAGTWRLPASSLEPLLGLLDRCGYHWTVSRHGDLPRTWAERLFAEVPAAHHAEVFAACRSALVDAPDHQALLEFAYEDVVRSAVRWDAFDHPALPS